MKNLIEEEIQRFNRVFPNSTFRYQERKVVQVYLHQSLTCAILATAERFRSSITTNCNNEFEAGCNFMARANNYMINQIISELNGEESK